MKTKLTFRRNALTMVKKVNIDPDRTQRQSFELGHFGVTPPAVVMPPFIIPILSLVVSSDNDICLFCNALQTIRFPFAISKSILLESDRKMAG